MDKKQETREKILMAAADSFAESGYEGARMDEIARNARVNKATIYYNIGNKEILYGTVIGKMFEDAFKGLAGKMTAGIKAEEKLRLYIRHFARALDSNPRFPKIMLREQVANGKNLPDIAAARMAEALGTLDAILEEGEREGIFENTSTLTVQFMIMGALMFFKTTAPLRNNQAVIPDKFRSLSMEVSGEVAERIAEYMIKALAKTR